MLNPWSKDDLTGAGVEERGVAGEGLGDVAEGVLLAFGEFKDAADDRGLEVVQGEPGPGINPGASLAASGSGVKHGLGKRAKAEAATTGTMI
jgi:hypothetical protein